MPSANGIPMTSKRVKKRGRTRRWLAIAIAALAALVLVFLVSLQILGVSGFGAKQLSQIAQSELRNVLGDDIETTIGSATFATQGATALTLDLQDVRIAKAGAESAAVGAQRLRLKLDTLALLTGRIRMTGAILEDAHILTGAMPGQTNSDWLNALLDDRGLLEPDKVLNFAFASADNAARLINDEAIPNIMVRNVVLELPKGLPTRVINVERATLAQDDGGLVLEGSANADGYTGEFDAGIVSNPQSGQARQFRMSFNARSQDIEKKSISLGTFTTSVSGIRGANGKEDRLELSVSGDNLSIDLGKEGVLEGALDILASVDKGTGKLEFDRFNARRGNSAFRFTGAIGPAPELIDGNPVYRFELVSTKSVLAPEDTNESEMPFAIRLDGNFDASRGHIGVANIDIANTSGRAQGKASVDLIGDGPPGIMMALNVHDMSISHVKQLWPWFAADGARRWVNENLFGGSVPSGFIHFQVPPNRLGNGVKLNAQEVSGRFDVAQTRFDIAGLLPPVRDAVGTVSFAGDDVEITLKTGNVFLANGKSVAARDGTLTITNARQKPIIGKLDLKVAGDASAVAEFASFEPINAMKNTGIEPSALAGPVEGVIDALIPMHKGIDKSLLDWKVDLTFQKLSISQPVDGQKIEDASGTITLDRQKAVIAAKALINGMPSELSMLQPIDPAANAIRERRVAFILDEKTQGKLSPVLDDLVSGAIKLDMTEKGDKRRLFEADLTAARLNLPMVGWSKGEGIPAKLTFELATQGDVARITGFNLAGATFRISGNMEIAQNTLRSAEFGHFQLTRDDDVSVSIKRSGKSYKVDVNGNSFDARALIRRLVRPDHKAGSGEKQDTVTVSANIASVIGFNDTRLQKLTLAYGGQGSLADLTLSAALDGRTPVNISNVPDGAGRRFRLVTQDAGQLLQFLDVYKRMTGGVLALSMAASGDNYAGQLDIRNFWIVNEPTVGAMVSTAPGGGTRSLNEAVKGNLDTTRVQFERGFANLEKGPSYLKVSNGVVRGPMVGATFQGTVYDQNDKMDMTGTFMPAYGLNRIFGEIPLIGELLGNGRDRGLIGVTFKVSGDFSKPRFQINPLSVIAPGIFRAIFEFQ